MSSFRPFLQLLTNIVPSFVFHSVCFASLLIDFISFSVVLFLYCHTNVIIIFVNDARRLERDIKDKSRRKRENRNMMKLVFLLAFVTATQSLSSEEIDDITSKIDGGKSFGTNHVILCIFFYLYLKSNCIFRSISEVSVYQTTKLRKIAKCFL